MSWGLPTKKTLLREGEAVAPAVENFFPAPPVEGKSSGAVGRGEAGTWPEEKLAQLPVPLPGCKMVLLSWLYRQMHKRPKKWQLK